MSPEADLALAIFSAVFGTFALIIALVQFFSRDK